ncbi:hypothetical protein ACVHYJ_17595 [Burkholderia pyrrocinia]
MRELEDGTLYAEISGARDAILVRYDQDGKLRAMLEGDTETSGPTGPDVLRLNPNANKFRVVPGSAEQSAVESRPGQTVTAEIHNNIAPTTNSSPSKLQSKPIAELPDADKASGLRKVGDQFYARKSGTEDGILVGYDTEGKLRAISADSSQPDGPLLTRIGETEYFRVEPDGVDRKETPERSAQKQEDPDRIEVSSDNTAPVMQSAIRAPKKGTLDLFDYEARLSGSEVSSLTDKGNGIYDSQDGKSQYVPIKGKWYQVEYSPSDGKYEYQIIHPTNRGNLGFDLVHATNGEWVPFTRPQGLGGAFTPNNEKNHYQKHGSEYPGMSQQQYATQAFNVVTAGNAGTGGVQMKTGANGDKYYYDSASNDFVATTGGGVYKTMFKPSAGQNYYNKQK